ncbi:hypothetical protein PR202_gb29236 [Eleusine coracana subsp. coracana]|uniref:Uncharacterized protein n=1 Tax=Eleusine coracana subsp. coracana TaxID=191504 RepID=A0AAV5FZ05_ELECO|nr:hypothetical protein PR202_gb29236 [Eleusine coracana subsp. coracana]
MLRKGSTEMLRAWADGQAYRKPIKECTLCFFVQSSVSRQFQVGLHQQLLWQWGNSSIRRKEQVHFLLAELSAPALLLKLEMFLAEDHPLVLNLSFSASLGLLPVTLSLKTAGCGIKNTGDQMEAERNNLCKLRCFPPVALAWDSVSGIHIVPNIYSETLVVDSSPAFWDSPEGTDRTTVLVLVNL